MDLTQQKLTKSEWEYLEIPVNIKEKKILKLIYKGFENVNQTFNESKSLLGFMKITENSDENFHLYLYENYFKKIIKKIIEKNNLSFDVKKILKNERKMKKLKQKDFIRLKNSSKKIDDLKDYVYEFILLQNISRFFKKIMFTKLLYINTIIEKFSIRYK